jgi:adenylate kinase family enzyme
MKIAIIGYSGSGKSTLAKHLGALYRLPVLHLDTLQFLPGWVERTREEKRADLARFLDENEGGWVIDGSYLKILPERRFSEADRILFLDLPRLACLARVVRRYRTYRGKTRDSIAPGCPEKLDAEFLLWVLFRGRTGKKRRQFRDILAAYPEKVRLLRSQRDIDRYLEECKGETV